MNKEDVNGVIDKIAEKLGVAADKVKPLAEEVVKQYSAEQRIWARHHGVRLVADVLIGGVLLWFLCASPFARAVGFRISLLEGDIAAGRICMCILQVSAVIVVACVALCSFMDNWTWHCRHKSHAANPLPSLLKELK